MTWARHDAGQAARRASVDVVIRRARWIGAVLVALQLVLYVPSDGVEPPAPVWWGLVWAVLLVALNVMPRLGSSRTRVREVVGVVGDSLAVLGLVGAFSFDAASALWTLMLLPVAEAAVRGWIRGAFVTWWGLGCGYVAVLVVADEALGTPMLTVDSITYRLGYLGLVTAVLAGLTGRLQAQIASAAASQAEADHLRAVALATRRMSSLDVPTVIREVAGAAGQLGFHDAQMWARTGRLAAGAVPDRPALDLSGRRFEEVAAATTERGWTVLDRDDVPGVLAQHEVLVVAALLAGDAVEALLVGRHRAPVGDRVGEALTLLAGQAGAALANALRYEEGRAFEERLAHHASHDDLTGLANRVLLGERGRRCLTHERRRGGLVALLFCDLDRFKQVNDVLGHAVGDALLRQVADRITAVAAERDVCARVGGDEFVVLSGGHRTADDVLDLAARLRAAIHRPFDLDGVTLDVEVSIGVAWSPDDGDDVDLLLQRADVAMYAAKRSRAGVVAHRDVAERDDAAHLAVLGDLRRALESDTQLEVHFQPIVGVADPRAESFEALVRWQHPTRGVVLPAAFVPVAEGTSLIHQLTDTVLDAALAAVAGWRAAGLLARVSVNLSPRALLDLSLISRVDTLLAQHGVPAEALCLEITEDTLVDDPTRAIATMHRLKELGVRLSIDDFGTGYSSMSYLKSLPVDEIKIDRSFVTDMLASVKDGSLVHSVVDLAHRLDLEVVAEGVEDAETWRALAIAGCDLVQGFHVARPMRRDEVLDWYRARHQVPRPREGGLHRSAPVPAPRRP